MNTYRVFDKAGRDAVMGHIADLELARPWTVIVKRYQVGRTLRQNSLFHKWCEEIAVFTGHSQTEIKEHLKRMFCPVTSRTEMGGIVTEHRHTSELDVAQMSEFMERVSAFAHGDLGVRLTVPEEQHIEAAASPGCTEAVAWRGCPVCSPNCDGVNDG